MRPTLRENVAGLRPIRGLLLAVAVARSSVLLFPFYGAYLGVTRSDMGPAGVGLIIGAFGVGALAADVVIGPMSRRLSERAIAICGMVGVTAVVLVISVSFGQWQLVVLTAVWGFCYELIGPVTYTMVAKAMPESAQRFGFAAVRLAINAGMGVGPVLAGLLFLINPYLLVWGTAIGYLVAAGILARAQVTDSGGPSDDPAQAVTRVSGRAVDELRFWSFFTAVIPIHFAFALPPTVISVYIIGQLGHPAVWVSAIFGINALIVITCEIGLNHLMNHWSRRSSLLCGFVCAAAGFGLMGFGADPIVLMPATVVWTLGEIMVFPVMLDHVSAISPHALKSRNIGLYSAGVNIGVFAAPLVFLPLSAVLDARTSWGLVAAFLACGALVIAALSAARVTWETDSAMTGVVADREVMASWPDPCTSIMQEPAFRAHK